MLQVGVVGCGYWGSKHLRVLNSLPEVGRIVAIDRDQDRLEHAVATFPSVETARALDETLDGLDALIVATPANSHAPIGIAALRAGVGVLIEKPLATTSADAVAIIDEAEAAGATLMVGHTFEYNAAVIALRELIGSGDLGEIYYIDSARLNLGLYQPDVNVIWDLAPHDLSVINYLLGETPSTVQAWGSRHASRDSEDVAYVQVSYEGSGVKAQVHVSWLDPCKVRRVTVVGSRQMAVYNDLNTDERLRVYDKGLSLNAFGGDTSHYPVSYRYGSIMSPYIEFEEPLLVEDRHFLECLMTGERPRTHGRSGLAVVRALEAANASLAAGRPVSVDAHTDVVGV